jgi:hypothetical protein
MAFKVRMIALGHQFFKGVPDLIFAWNNLRLNSRQSFTIIASPGMMTLPAEKHLFRRQVNCGQRKQSIMGDRSPKANQKKSTQKQSKTNTATAKKNATVAAKQAAGKKK